MCYKFKILVYTMVAFPYKPICHRAISCGALLETSVTDLFNF